MSLIETKNNDRHAAYHTQIRDQRVPSMSYADIPEELRQTLSLAQITMARRFSFEAALLAPMKLHVVADDEPINTAATDCYRNVWVNAEFMATLTVDDVQMVLAHEAYHALLLDGVRREARNPKVWNWAADLRINGILKLRGFSFKAFPHRLNLAGAIAELKSQAAGYPPTKYPDNERMCFLDTTLGIDTSVERIYEMLMEHMPPPKSGSGGSDTVVINDAMGGDVQPDAKSDKDGASGGGSGDGDGDGEGEGEGTGGKSRDQLQAEMNERAARGALAEQAGAKRRGEHVDEFIGRFVDNLLKEQVSWPVVLRRLMRKALARDDYSMRRPSRRGLARGVVLPSLRSEALNKICAISDTSGSVSSAELQAQASEVAAIVRQANAKMTEVAFVDTEVRNTQSFRRGEAIKFKPKGGGGTDFRPGIAWAETHRPDVCIYFTDGYGPFPETPPPFPVIWVLTGARTIKPSQVPWGMVMEIN